jgi:hypothetical protein
LRIENWELRIMITLATQKQSLTFFSKIDSGSS